MRTSTDQTIKADAGKEQVRLVPRRIIKRIARIREYGNNKYGDEESWRRVELHRYKDAAFRHFLDYLDDPKSVDAESGLSHLWHLACNIAFLIEREDEDESTTSNVHQRRGGNVASPPDELGSEAEGYSQYRPDQGSDRNIGS